MNSQSSCYYVSRKQGQGQHESQARFQEPEHSQQYPTRAHLPHPGLGREIQSTPFLSGKIISVTKEVTPFLQAYEPITTLRFPSSISHASWLRKIVMYLPVAGIIASQFN